MFLLLHSPNNQTYRQQGNQSNQSFTPQRPPASETHTTSGLAFKTAPTAPRSFHPQLCAETSESRKRRWKKRKSRYPGRKLTKVLYQGVSTTILTQLH
jgi:hypothetical protein